MSVTPMSMRITPLIMLKLLVMTHHSDHLNQLMKQVSISQHVHRTSFVKKFTISPLAGILIL